jgi:hypothetical protein
VRFLVGQTSTGDDVLLTDEEIAWAISETANSYYAAALCAETLAGRYEHEGPESETIGRLSVSWGDRARKFAGLAARLRREGSVRNAAPFLGGQSVDDREGREGDTDLRQPAFGTKQFDYPGMSTGDTST